MPVNIGKAVLNKINFEKQKQIPERYKMTKFNIIRESDFCIVNDSSTDSITICRQRYSK